MRQPRPPASRARARAILPGITSASIAMKSMDVELQHQLLHHVGVAPADATPSDLMAAAAHLAREQLSQRWVATQAAQRGQRRVYYLSMEFLMGRTLGNALEALGLHDGAAAALRDMAQRLEDAEQHEADAGLGNGGLGRLAACFLDSMATLGLPSFGYGIRYEYGMFAQAIVDGRQVEHPDPWLGDGSPWEFRRRHVHFPVHFGGHVDHSSGQPVWLPADEVSAKAFDMVVPGYGTPHVSTLRLWQAAAPTHIDLHAFNSGDYARAAEVKNQFENISWVLYPNDSTPAGRELRLRQEYFFTSASIQDIVARHVAEHRTLASLADKVAIHLNDTHPAIGVAELLRLLCDEHSLPWAEAWAITQRVFSYTNHTLMPEALESWPVGLIQHVLPRHLEIILRINQELLDHAAAVRPHDEQFLRRLSLIDESGERRVRMAHLSVVGSHKVNGVSALHSDLLVKTIFADFASLWPGRFTNMTNGVTPRRWLAHAKPRLAAHILASTGQRVDPASLFDVQVKRIHEYKRQLLNLLHIVARWQQIVEQPGLDWVPRTAIFAGKAASGYHMAKQIIRLIHDVGRVINHDTRTAGRLKLVFVPNYGVSVAEVIIPGADLSEQISTAGTEASGTGNMKLALNGALTIGTDDGANIEIRQCVGDEHIFIFGHRAQEVAALRAGGYQPLR